MTLLARIHTTHAGRIYEPGDEIDECPIDKGRPAPIDAAFVIADGIACDPDLCEDPDCQLHGTDGILRGRRIPPLTPAAGDVAASKPAPRRKPRPGGRAR